MKILLIIDQFFSANNGMTISARRFAETLVSHGNEVRVVSTGQPGDTEYLMKKQYIPLFDKLVTSQGMTFAKPDDAVLTRAVAWADVVHFLVPFVLTHHAIKIAQKSGVPFTGAFHVQPENVTSSIHLAAVRLVNDAIYAWFRHYCFKYCGHIHCPSAFIADELRRHGYKSALHVISNGIDPEFVYRKREKPEGLRDRFLILSIGRLSIEKRQDVIIRAIARSRHRDKISLLIAGQGPRRAQLTKLAAKLGVPLKLGFYPKRELINLISRCDLYVHAADAEIEAMSCMEAFAGGLVPVIADSPKSATPQFALTPDSLFRAGNPAALAEKIDYWIEHTELRREYEKKYAESAKQYKLDDCVYKAEEMFRQAVSENADKRTV